MSTPVKDSDLNILGSSNSMYLEWSGQGTINADQQRILLRRFGELTPQGLYLPDNVVVKLSLQVSVITTMGEIVVDYPYTLYAMKLNGTLRFLLERSGGTAEFEPLDTMRVVPFINTHNTSIIFGCKNLNGASMQGRVVVKCVVHVEHRNIARSEPSWLNTNQIATEEE